MAAVKTEFTEFIAEEIKKYDGVRMPLKNEPDQADSYKMDQVPKSSS